MLVEELGLSTEPYGFRLGAGNGTRPDGRPSGRTRPTAFQTPRSLRVSLRSTFSESPRRPAVGGHDQVMVRALFTASLAMIDPNAETLLL